MKNILIIAIVLIASCVSYAALFDPPDAGSEPTYTTAELATMFGKLEDYYGDCTAIFVAEGLGIDLCDCAYSFSKSVESYSFNRIVANPTWDETTWRNTLYSTYLQHFPSSKWATMFNTLTQGQFNALLNRIIWWNPLPYDNTRTYTAYRTWVLSQ